MPCLCTVTGADTLALDDSVAAVDGMKCHCSRNGMQRSGVVGDNVQFFYSLFPALTVSRKVLCRH